MQIHLSVPEARALKTNLRNSPMTFARDKVKEAQKAQRRCEAMSNNHLAIGETNQEATLTYHLER